MELSNSLPEYLRFAIHYSLELKHRPVNYHQSEVLEGYFVLRHQESAIVELKSLINDQ